MKIAGWWLVFFVLGVLGLLALSLPSPGELASGYLARGEYRLARQYLAGQLRRDPRDVRAWLDLATVHEALGDPERQILALEIAARRFPREREPLERLVGAYDGARDVGGAISALERLAQRPDGAQVGILVRLLNLYAWTEQHVKADLTLRRLAAVDSLDAGTVENVVAVARSLDRLDQALAMAERHVAMHPRDEAAQRALAHLYESIGDIDRARARWSVVAGLAPDDPQARDRSTPARQQAGAPDEVAQLEEARKADPRDESARRRLVTLLRAAGEVGRAESVQREVVGLRPRDAGALITLAELLVAQDRGAEAIALYEGALPLAPDRLPPALALAQLYEWGNQPARALALLEGASRGHPADRPLAERVVALAEAAGQPDRAVAALDRLAALDPSSTRYLRKAIDVLIAADRSADAIPRLRRLLEQAPGSAPDALLLAQLYEWANQPAQATAVIERLATARPSDRPLAERLVALAVAAGEPDRALDALARLSRQFPREPRYPRDAVEVLLAAGRAAAAVPWQRRLVDLSPGAVSPRLRLAELYEWAGHQREAVEVYEALDRAGNLDHAQLAHLATLYRYQDRPRDFLRMAQGLLARQPGDAALTLDYVTVAAEQGQVEEALRVHRRFLATAGGLALDHRARVARVLADAARYPEAISEYEAVLATASTAPLALEARIALAQLHDWSGAPDRALAQWEAIARIRPGDVTVLRHVGRRSLAAGRTEVALRAYRAILLQRPDDPEALKRVGQVLAWTNDSRGARQALERFNRVKGGDHEVHSQLGDLYASDRDEDRARAQYEKALRLVSPRAVSR